jgi:hypothetical protein
MAASCRYPGIAAIQDPETIHARFDILNACVAQRAVPTYAAAFPISSRKYVMRKRRR